MTCKITQKSSRNGGTVYDLGFKGLTLGQMRALRNALFNHGAANGSVLADELLAFLKDAAGPELAEALDP